MQKKTTILFLTLALGLTVVLLAIMAAPARLDGNKWNPAIPKTWDEQAMASLETPLANSAASPKHVSADYYYEMPVRPVYRSFPIYRPDKEPAGYFESLKQKEPEITFDASKLQTEADWIKAGELVFDAAVEFDTSILSLEVRDPAWYSVNHVPVTKDGIMPFMRYVIREKGKVEVGTLACAMCHTRVMPDGNVIKGAQGNFPDDRTAGFEVKVAAARAKDPGVVLGELRSYMRRSYAEPWLQPDPNALTDHMSIDEITNAMQAITPGSCGRQGSSLFYPTRIPDLIGVKERSFLDNTGLFRQRDIGDLMRYIALNQGADVFSQYGDFRPVGELPDPLTRNRYSDEQLYALALFVYSLKPPPNPNKFDDLAARGQAVFKKEGCAGCHTTALHEQ